MNKLRKITSEIKLVDFYFKKQVENFAKKFNPPNPLFAEFNTPRINPARSFKIPFNEQYAKEGAVVETKCGHSVKIVDYNADCGKYPILALINVGEREIPVLYSKEGYTDVRIDGKAITLVIIARVLRENLPSWEIANWLLDDRRMCKYRYCVYGAGYETLTSDVYGESVDLLVF